jgi:uncharacterized C2H2 Zn-finger protein
MKREMPCGSSESCLDCIEFRLDDNKYPQCGILRKLSLIDYHIHMNKLHEEEDNRSKIENRNKNIDEILNKD